MAGLIEVAAIQGVLSGIGNIVQGKQVRDEQRAQAKQIRDTIIQLNEDVKAGEERIEDAIERIQTMVDNTKGELKDVINTQINLAINDQKAAFADLLLDYNEQLDKYRATMTDEQQKQREAFEKQLLDYRKSLQESRQALQGELSRRRLLGSEAGTAARRKSEEVETKGVQQILENQNKLEQKFAETLSETEEAFATQKRRATAAHERELAGTRQRGAAQLTQALTDVGFRGLGMTEGLQAEKRGLLMDAAQQEIMLSNAAEILERQAGEPGLGGDILRGAGDFFTGFTQTTGGLPITSAILGLGKSKQESQQINKDFTDMFTSGNWPELGGSNGQ